MSNDKLNCTEKVITCQLLSILSIGINHIFVESDFMSTTISRPIDRDHFVHFLFERLSLAVIKFQQEAQRATVAHLSAMNASKI